MEFSRKENITVRNIEFYGTLVIEGYASDIISPEKTTTNPINSEICNGGDCVAEIMVLDFCWKFHAMS